MKLPDKYEDVFGKLLFVNKSTYIIGGFLRDTLLNKEPADIDFAMQGGDYWEIIDKCEDLFHYVIPMGHKHGTFVIDGEFEVTVTRDIMRKLSKENDFTINGIAMNGTDGFLFHPDFDQDMKSKVIRESYTGAIKADPIRLLRGYRLADKLGFEFVHSEDMTARQLIEVVSEYRLKREVSKSKDSIWLKDKFPELLGLVK